MKESATIATDVTTKQLEREVWLGTKGQYMKESNTHVDNASSNFLIREVLVNT